jgi:hypothetical protein
LFFDLEAGGSRFLQNAGNFLPDYTPCESQIQLTVNCHKEFKWTSASAAYGIILGILKIASADTLDEDQRVYLSGDFQNMALLTCFQSKQVKFWKRQS